MKTVSVIQPWASFAGLYIKKNETRSWYTNYRGDLLIHASQKLFPESALFPHMIGKLFHTRVQLLQQLETASGCAYKQLPIGKIIAKTRLVDCLRVVKVGIGWAQLSDGRTIDGVEWHLGDYSIDRFIWILEGSEMLATPIPARGQLGLWEFDYESRVS